MPNVELSKLEQVRLEDVWWHEAHDFTPWLADNLDLLGEELNIDLEHPRTEVRLPGAGQVDILAKQAGTDATVVIENQLAPSDDDHFLRLLGYAASSEADILIWVASKISDRHRGILELLNKGDGIDIYGVEVSAWRIGESFAPCFRVVMEPRPGTTSGPVTKPASGTDLWNANRAYGEFYRPLVADLRREGIIAVGRGGFRGRYRSFNTGYEDQGVIYALGISEEGTDWVGLRSSGEHFERIHEALLQRKSKFERAMSGAIIEEVLYDTVSWIGVSKGAVTSEEEREATRDWMFQNLVNLRNAIQPHLDGVMEELSAGEGLSGDDSEPIE